MRKPMLTYLPAPVTPDPMIATARISSSQPLAPLGRKTASGGLRPVARRRLSRRASQATDASGKIMPGYDRARRRSHLPQSGLKSAVCSLFSKNPNARGTLQVGPAGSGRIPLLGGVAFGGGLAIDRAGNVALYGYAGKLIGTGIGGAAGLSVQASDARGVSNLAGPFAVASATAGAGWAGSADVFVDPVTGDTAGGGMTFGGGGGYTVNGGVTTTKLWQIGNLASGLGC
jgi:hypothetical protein